MPNWVDSRLIITGKAKAVSVVFDDMKRALEDTFHRTDLPAKDMRPRMSMRPCMACLTVLSTERFDLRFETAWAPASEWVDALAILYPQVTFELAYCEQGMQFFGAYKVTKRNVEIHKWEGGSNFWAPTEAVDECGEEVYDPSDLLQAHLDKYGIGLGG